MVDRREDALLAQVRKQLGHVVAEPLDLGVLRLGDAQYTEMHAHRIVREDAGDLGANDDVRTVGDRERAIDPVMVRDRDEVHPPRLRAAIDSFGGVVGLLQEPIERTDRRAARVDGMNVRVQLHTASCRLWGALERAALCWAQSASDEDQRQNRRVA